MSARTRLVGGRLTVAESAHVWLLDLAGLVSPNTLASYRSIVRCHIAPSPLGAMPLEAVGREDVRRFLLATFRSGKSPGYVGLMLSVLREVAYRAIDQGLLTTNPMLRVWGKRPPPELRVRRDPADYTPPDGMGTRILDALHAEHPGLHRLACVYAKSGMRRSEALGLQTSDVSFRDSTITLRRQWHGNGRVGPLKGRRPRTIDMSRTLEAILTAAIVESAQLAHRLGCPLEPAWIFRGPTGRPWSPAWVSRRLQRVSIAVAGQSYGAKAFRHAVATALLTRGEHPRYVQLLLGHAHLSTTMQYVAHRGMRRRSAVDGLDDL